MSRSSSTDNFRQDISKFYLRGRALGHFETSSSGGKRIEIEGKE